MHTSDSVPIPPTAGLNRLRGLLMAWMFVAGVVGMGLIGPNRMAIRQEFGLSETAYGAGLALTQIAAASVVLLFTGPLARRRPIRVLMLALAVEAAGFLVTAATHSASGLAGGWMLVTAGLALGGITNSVGMTLWPVDPHRGIVLLHALNGGGKIAGPLLAALCVGLSWRTNFALVGVLTLAVLAAFLLPGQATPPPQTVPTPRRWHGRELLSALFFMAGTGMISGGEMAFASLLPEYLVVQRGLGHQAGVLALSVLLVGLTCGRFLAAHLGTRVGHSAILAGCLAAGLGVFPAVFATHPAVILAALFVLGFQFSSTWPTFYAACAGGWLAPRSHWLPYGSALGNFIGLSACLFISSAIADRSLTAAMLFGPAVLWLFGVMYFARVWWSRRDAALSAAPAGSPAPRT